MYDGVKARRSCLLYDEAFEVALTHTMVYTQLRVMENKKRTLCH